jgi:glutamate dehydrogenase (NADP+)
MVFYAPGKAANAGGVAVSGLEMAQNSQRLKWTPAEVDAKLKDIMVTCCEWRGGPERSEQTTSTPVVPCPLSPHKRLFSASIINTGMSTR